MDKSNIKKVVERANKYLEEKYKEGSITYELRAIEKSVKEHTYCYSVGWCLKNEVDLPVSRRTRFAGGGPVMISKISDDVEMAGSAPTVDWIKQFELKVRGLEGYWSLEIMYDKTKISSLKTLLGMSTPDLLKRINENSIIEVEGENYQLKNLQEDLKTAGISSTLKLRAREKHTDSTK